MTKFGGTLFPRAERDFYPTPNAVADVLARHLPPFQFFAEPCAGNGALQDRLAFYGHACTESSDIAPQREGIARMDALAWIADPMTEVIITNPPFERRLMHAMINHLSDQRPTRLLLDCGWWPTHQAAPFFPRLREIVSVGRVR